MKASNSGFTVLPSSAGAGKTHTLVTQYLARCLGRIQGPGFNPKGFRHVLALTFTNDAAEEMSERVIEYLSELSKIDATQELNGPLADVAKTLQNELDIQFDELQKRARQMLKQMLHDRSAVAISTIDAFTKKVARPFTRELQFEWDQEMTTEQKYYDTLAVDALLDRTEPGSPESQILMRACDDVIDNEAKWDVREPLQEMMQQLNDETSVERLKSYKYLEAEDIIKTNKDLAQRIAAYKRKWRDTGKQALELISTSALEPEDFPNRQATYKLFLQAAHYDGKAPSYKTAFKYLFEQELLGDKYNGPLTGAASVLRQALVPLAEDIRNLLETQEQEELLPGAIRKELMMVATLSYLEIQLNEVKKEEGVTYFSDLTRAISKIVQAEPTPFVYERIGERFTHILIDEFQDTSILQWQNLIPLVENALSNGGTALLVGDAKQAIYRWRNGEVRQFSELPRIFRKDLLIFGERREAALAAHYGKREPLKRNFRSGNAIVEFNNTFYKSAAAELGEELKKIYAEHEQEAVDRFTGYVRVEIFPKEKGQKIHDLRIKCMDSVVEIIEQVSQLGYAKSDIVLLVRSKKHGALAAKHLVDNKIKVASSDSFELGKDLRVQLIVEQLKFLDERNDVSAGRIHALLETLDLRKDTFSYRESGFIDAPRSVDNLLEPVLTERKKLSFYELISQLISNCSLDPSKDMMLLSLLDICHEHGKYGNAGIRSFLAHWERSHSSAGVQLTEDESAVKIMTVHGSKGLGIPVVIVPFAEMRGGGNHKNPIWINAEEYGLKDALVSHKNALSDAGVPEALEESELKVLDELNTLYVATTRASHHLYVLVPSGDASPASKALEEFVANEGAENVWDSGDPLQEGSKKETTGNTVLLQELGFNDENKLVFRKEAPDNWKTEDPDPYRTHGDRVHELFEHMNSVSDFERAFDQANAIEPLPAGIKEQIQELLAKPEVAAFYAPDIEGENEPTILLGPNEFVRPDRVVFDKGKARVLDIKTGKQRPKHKEQIGKYKQALAALGYSDIDGYLLYLKDGELVEA